MLIIRRRILIIYLLCMLLSICVLIRLSYLKIIASDEYYEKALNLGTRSAPVEGRRGNIYDRNGKLIVGSVLAPSIALFTDITPNHLEHHKSFSAYFHAKLRLVMNMKENDLVILPRNNIVEEEFSNKDFEKIMYDNQKSDNGIFCDGEYLYYNDNITTKPIIKISDTDLNAFFNIKNTIGALVIALKLGISLLTMRKTIKAFKPPIFRLQKIFDDGKLIIYNDAKSTNPYSLISALKSINKNDECLYWLAGGIKRSEDWSQLDEVIDKIDLAFLYGENRYEITDYLDSKGIPYYLNNTLDNHVENLIIDDLPTILLFSPALPSLDQYSSFEARGRIFNDLIMKRLRIDI